MPSLTKYSLILSAGAAVTHALPWGGFSRFGGGNFGGNRGGNQQHGASSSSSTISVITTEAAATAPTVVVSSSAAPTVAVSSSAVSSSAVASSAVAAINAQPAKSTVKSSASATSAAGPTVTSASSTTNGVNTSGVSSDCIFNDAASASASKTSCSTIVLSAIAVPSGTTLDMTDLNDGTTVIFEGETTWEYDEWDGPLFSVSGTGITVQAASGAVLNPDGARWWDGEGSNGGVTKPKFFYAHDLTDSTISGLTITNTPIQCFSVNGASGLTISDVTIDNSDGDTQGGHNTDAYDVGSSDGVTITGAVVYNQDDCLAINSGTNIKFTGATCSGGHGISIGSVGGRSDNTVSGITVSDCTIKDSANGVRIKTVYDATGEVSDVTYSGITLSNITDYGIVIEQDYENGSPTGTPTDGVPITDLTIENVTGTVADDAEQVYILCASGACSGWTWTGVDITGGSASTSCENVPTGASC